MQKQTIEGWLESLAAKQPTPGGGAAAALAAATSAALLGMVSIYTTGPKWAEHEKELNALYKKLAKLRKDSLLLVQDDAIAFSEVGSAYKLPKDSDMQKKKRENVIEKALITAATPPVKTAQLAAQLVDIAGLLADKGNPSVISDVAVGASFAKTALESAIVNIEINENYIKDAATKKSLIKSAKQAAESAKQADLIIAKVRNKIKDSVK
jgi:formiminotetrahydrofolate cyclodeaminase